MKQIAALILFLLAGTAALAQTPKPQVEIPFEFVHNQIVVQAKLGGKGPFNLLVDTDTDPSAIDLATARDLGLAVGSKGGVGSGGGTDANMAYPTRLPSVELGSFVTREVVAVAIDLTKISKRAERPIHGVLGFSFLKDRIIQIDYPNTKLRFFSESPYPRIQMSANTVNLISLPFKREDGVVIVDSVFINNEKMRAALDTGSSGSFDLTPEAVALLGMDDKDQSASPVTSIGYNGEFETRQGILKSVRLGRIAVESVPAVLWLPKTGHDNKKYQVNIGNGFFQDFVMTFDFKGKQVVFEKVD
ncbi:MAG TPA: retroviral-like aspartic protease family protein [Pyrinomonadaceae bacterium]|nr:retroviral-like aspartic protease family protein [Pyrinomonadaceae bacterium]